MKRIIEEYHCDRCGKELDKEPLFYTQRLSILTRQFSLKKLSNSWEVVDLCDNCKKEFINWWNEDK